MPFKSISRHQPSQREPKLSWPSLTGKSLRVCRYHQNKTPQRSSLPKQQQSSNHRQQKAPSALDAAGSGSYFRPLAEVISVFYLPFTSPKACSHYGQRHFMGLQALKRAIFNQPSEASSAETETINRIRSYIQSKEKSILLIHCNSRIQSL